MIGIRAFAWASLLALGVSSAEQATRPSAAPIELQERSHWLFNGSADIQSSSWTKCDHRGFVQRATEDGFSANVNIQVHQLRFDDFVKTSDAQFESPGIEVVSKKDLRIGARSACEWVYKATVQSYRAKFIGLAVDKGDCVLLVTATSLEQSFEKNETWMRDALSSVKVDP